MAVQTATGAEEVVWNLGDLFAGVDDPAIESTLAEINAKADRFAEQYRGRVATLDGEELVDALYEAEQFTDIAYRLFSFASLGWAAETTNPANGALLQKIREASSQIQQKTLFFELEWANVADEQAKLADNPMLARWQHYLHKQRRMRPYLLSEAEEKILAEKSVYGVQAWTRFFNELMSASRYELDGEQLPQDVVLRKLYTPEREVRKRAAAAMTTGLRENLKTTTYIFNTVLAEKASDDRLRKYPTWISARNLDNEASDETVEALVQAVTSRYDIVARYYGIKRRLLGLDELY
jgi:oligoendopeptidase F